MALKKWASMLDALKSTDCKLICFSDLYIPEDKIAKKLNSQNVGYEASNKLYKALENRKIDLQTILTGIPRRPLKSVFYGMAIVAHDKCDEFYRSTKHEADFAIATYAEQHEVMAILSSDSDFLIFGGTWQLWSANDIRFTKDRLETIEYDRNKITQTLSLSTHQLPLFATLLGNDRCKCLGVNDFFKSTNLSKDRVRNIAQYVHDMSCAMENSTRISNADLKRIITPILKDNENYNKKEELIRKSIDSYITNHRSGYERGEPIEERFAGSGVYRSYMLCINPIHEQHMQFYDLRGSEPVTNLPDLLTDWIKRKRGIIVNNTRDRPSTFTLLIKKEVSEQAKAYTETLTYPDCEFTLELSGMHWTFLCKVNFEFYTSLSTTTGRSIFGNE